MKSLKFLEFRKKWKVYIYSFFIIVILGIVFFFNFTFQVKNINIEFFEANNLENKDEVVLENENIKKYLLEQINKNVNTYTEYFFLDNNLLTKLMRDEYEMVNRIDINRKIYYNNFKNFDFGFLLYLVVIKNDKYFYVCVEEGERENFLVWSMQGNSEGEFYKEINQSLCFDNEEKKNELKNQIKFILNPKSLYSKNDEEKFLEPDSIADLRIYRKKDFKNLKQIIFYLQKNGFEIKEIYVNELKLIDINLYDYVLKINLDKDVENTISDFETISRAGKLQKYINGDKKNIEYIDLTFENKVFYKLKNSNKLENDTENVIMSTSSTSTQI